MIKNIDITHYRKLKNLQLPFNQGVNLISGTNGTCKSSILHIIGNTFQGFKRTTTGVNSEALNIIRTINKYTNPKVERYYVAVAQRPKFKQNRTKMPLFR